jgi:hypothetical protein
LVLKACSILDVATFYCVSVIRVVEVYGKYKAFSGLNNILETVP